jgi:uncharacterized membrane protein (DUF485 family)
LSVTDLLIGVLTAGILSVYFVWIGLIQFDVTWIGFVFPATTFTLETHIQILMK